MPDAKSAEHPSLPPEIREFIISFMRSINTARLYATDHVLFKEHSQQLLKKLRAAIAARDFLFLGFARDALFLEGDFYHPREPHLDKFLKFFHLLGISYLLLEKELTAKELDCFLGLVAGVRQGQGRDLSAALPRENIEHLKLGLLDYSIFSAVAAVTAQIVPSEEDEAIWRQLILYPAGTAMFNLSPEQLRDLARLCDEVAELKKLLQEIDRGLEAARPETGVLPKGILLANFIQNLAATVGQIVPEKRRHFARQLNAVLDSLEPRLKMEILGAPTGSAAEQEGNVIQEVFLAMPDEELVSLLAIALEEEGAESPCFLNLFGRALEKYKDPTLLLALVRKEMHRATLEGRPGHLSSWQHLEQLVIRRQEIKELDEQYHKEIEALATSLQLEMPVAEEEEMDRLLATLKPDSLQMARAKLIIDLLGQPFLMPAEAALPPLLQSFGKTIGAIYAGRNFVGAGNLLRQAYLAIAGQPHEAQARKILESLLSTEDVRELLERLLQRCRTYGPTETVAINAICQLYPEKAATYLLELLQESEEDDGEGSRWLLTTLASLGSGLSRPLSRKLDGAPGRLLPKLLMLVAMSANKAFASGVEKLLEHRDQEVRIQAASVLGKLGAAKAVPRLAGIVQKRSWLKTRKEKALQAAAARALAEIGTDEARAVLQQVAEQGSGELQTLCRELLQG